MQANSRYHKLFHFNFAFVLLNLKSVERKGKNYKKIEYLKNEKSFLDEIKNFFIVFKELQFSKKKIKI